MTQPTDVKNFNLTRFKLGAENILGLASPGEWSGRLKRYELSHSILTIELSSSYGVHDLEFEGVLWIQGTMWWKGCNCCIAEEGALLDAFNHTYDGTNYAQFAPSDFLPGQLDELGIKLIIFYGVEGEFRVLASLMSLIENVR